MALIVCPDCGKQISDLATVCIGCGRPMEVKKGKLVVTGRKDGWNKNLYYLYDSNGNFFGKLVGGEKVTFKIEKPITLTVGHKRGSFLGCAVKDSAPVYVDPETVTYLEASMTPGLGNGFYSLTPIDPQD